jgi:hypothetical protein
LLSLALGAYAAPALVHPKLASLPHDLHLDELVVVVGRDDVRLVEHHVVVPVDLPALQ